MNHETKEQLDPQVRIEVDETELEAIAAALQVQSGLRAGIIPCL